MVLWEITLGTAYFLGLKRTYRLALKIQRRIISPKRPRIRQFVHRRTRAVFDIALKVHQNIQQRDLEVGRNLGNWILRWLDKMKPSAQIRPPSHQKPHHGTGSANMNITKQVNNSSKTPRSLQTPRNGEADRRLFSSSRYMLSKSLPTIAMMIRPPKAAGNMTQYRHLSINGPHTLQLNYTRGEGVIRKDIMQWMLHN
ncbi:envelope glycoprotein [Gossypium australe]|uniref:Envelope glycoprotein n=1 Tax=Gossypium australe TaxID=47621 RepID=A0A5B6VJ63_9ROSI|nr:envelope glycoprotein [Gossypium australe]